MIEKPPFIDGNELFKALDLPLRGDIADLVNKINDSYKYWDAVKYEKTPEDVTPQELWGYVKAARMHNRIIVWKKYDIHLTITNEMQRLCHEFDMSFGGSWGDTQLSADENKEHYLISSLMEEAIFSSQMEGAATTRIVAKEMLRKKVTPKDKSQQMITNNYQTIRYIVEHKDTPLSEKELLHIHKLMTDKTLANAADAGRFRTNNDVVVEEKITHETVHVPPSYEEIPEFVNDLCTFFNEKKGKVFIHPIIRGIIIHFMIAYMHPFADGNGRTARALFYWYMLKQNYWLTEYLSISRVIAKSKKSYEKAFLYTEADSKDMGYFAAYNLRVLELSFKQLQSYIKKKRNEKKVANTFLQLGEINNRQAQIIKIYVDNPKEVLTVKDIQNEYLVSATTAKSDIVGLMKRGLLKEISFNRVKKGYMRSDEFDTVIKPLLNN